MNSKGLFSLVLLLFFIVLSLKAGSMQLNFSEKSKQKTLLSFEMEKSSFVRAQLETNFDFLVKKAIFEGGKISLDSEFLKDFLSDKIFLFVLGSKKIYSNTTDFFIFKKSGLLKHSFSKEQMEELFNINVIAQKKLFLAEFNFNGGTEKNIFFGAQIKNQNFSQDFLITPGYTEKVFGLAVG